MRLQLLTYLSSGISYTSFCHFYLWHSTPCWKWAWWLVAWIHNQTPWGLSMAQFLYSREFSLFWNAWLIFYTHVETASTESRLGLVWLGWKFPRCRLREQEWCRFHSMEDPHFGLARVAIWLLPRSFGIGRSLNIQLVNSRMGPSRKFSKIWCLCTSGSVFSHPWMVYRLHLESPYLLYLSPQHQWIFSAFVILCWHLPRNIYLRRLPRFHCRCFRLQISALLDCHQPQRSACCQTYLSNYLACCFPSLKRQRLELMNQFELKAPIHPFLSPIRHNFLFFVELFWCRFHPSRSTLQQMGLVFVLPDLNHVLLLFRVGLLFCRQSFSQSRHLPLCVLRLPSIQILNLFLMPFWTTFGYCVYFGLWMYSWLCRPPSELASLDTDPWLSRSILFWNPAAPTPQWYASIVWYWVDFIWCIPSPAALCWTCLYWWAIQTCTIDLHARCNCWRMSLLSIARGRWCQCCNWGRSLSWICACR